MKKNFEILLLVAALLSLGLGQNFHGGRLAHLETGTMVLTGEGITQQTFTRENIFSTTEEVNIATAIAGYSSEVAYGAPEKFTHIEVLDAYVNSMKTAILINLDITHPTGTSAVVYEVTLSYIIVGSDMEGFYDSSSVMSSYIFARNGDLLETPSGSAVLYDFKSGTIPSPFNYPNAENTGCGAHKDTSGNWRVEDVGCGYSGIHVYITGFSINPSPQQDTGDISLELIVNVGTNDEDLIVPVYSETTTADGITITLDNTYIQAADQQRKVQLSMVFVGVREYPASYPTQIFNVDEFKFNALSISQAAIVMLVDAATIQFSPAAVDNVHYEATNADQVGHLFCGFYGLVVDTNGLGYEDQFGFRVTEFQLDGTFDLIVSQIGANTFELDEIYWYCDMFTATITCSETTTELTVDPAVSPTAVTTSTTFISDFPAAVPSAVNQYQGGLVASPIIISQTADSPTTVTYTITYSSVENKPYEGFIHIASLDIATVPATAAELPITVKVVVFGTLVYLDTFNLVAGMAQTQTFAFFNYGSDNTVVIEYTTSVAAAYSNYLQFGLIEHSNVITSPAGQCLTMCPQPTGFSVGIDSSSIPPTCIDCPTSLNQQFNPNTQACGCVPGRVLVGGVCTLCTDPLCHECNPAALATCITCMEFAIVSATTSTCACLSNYYSFDNGQYLQCKKCPQGCLTCTSQTTCTTCVTSSTRRAPAELCACLSGYYEVGADECLPCSGECQECTGTATQCSQCDTAGNFVAEGTTCNCADGYFKVIGATETTCEACDPSCITCVNTATQCVSCGPTRDLNANDECVCKAGYTQFQGDCIDTNCQVVDPNCASCQILLGSGQLVCKTCTGANRILSSGACVCEVGYVEIGGACSPCGTGCAICTSTTDCILCALESIDNNDGTCSCPKGTFLINVDNTLYCRPCASNCADCFNAEDTCTECINGYVANDQNTCVCPAGTYVTPDLSSCLSCMPRCNACTGPTDCSECQANTVWDGTQCALQCPVGTYNAGSQCKQCSQFCSACTTSFSCQQCFNGYFMFVGSCKQSCPLGTYPQGFTCVACSPPCATCSGTAVTCTSCGPGYILHAGQCLNDCPVGTYFSQGACQACSTLCADCEGTSITCIACADGKYLVDGKCQDQCPSPLVDGKCITKCPSGTYSTGNACPPCMSPCVTCSGSATSCTECQGGTLAYNGNCIQSCPPNTITFDTYCLDCDPSCNGCSLNPFACHSCANGYFQLNENCVSTCPDGYYTDYSRKACRKCDANCQRCTGPGQCSVCESSGVIPINGQCSNQCGANCLKCVDFNCQLCAEGTLWTGILCVNYCPLGSQPVNGVCVCDTGFLHQGQCVNSCPIGYTEINGMCKQCDVSCADCDGDIVTCTACEDGKVLDLVSNRCVASNDCPFGRYRNYFGQCKVICPPGTFYLDSTCYEANCPAGYKTDLQNQACVEDSPPTGCTRPYYLQGRQCVLTCDPTFYPNPVNRVCTACPTNCYSCLSATFCLSCVPGFEILNNLCAVSNGCSANLYKYYSVCLPTCPPGTYNKGGYCVPICPAGSRLNGFGCYSTCPALSTPEACVTVCPPGFSLNGQNCFLNTRSCSQGQYFNALSNSCQNCQFPCKTCTGSPVTCDSCQTGYNLNGTSCSRSSSCPPGQYGSFSGCLPCPEKCGTCLDVSTCSTCATGYINTGADCVRQTGVLTPLQLQTGQLCQNNNTAYVEIQFTVIPNEMSSALIENFVLVVLGNPALNPLITVWVVGNSVWLALRYTSLVPTDTVYVIPASTVSSIYESMGFTTANVFAIANIGPNLPSCPSNVSIPPIAVNVQRSVADKAGPLNSQFIKAVREKKRSLD